MAILAECDICGAQHRVKDAWIGNLIRCKDCGVQIKVPKDAFITPESFFEEGGRLRRREPEQKSSLWPWIVATIVAGTIVVVLTSLVWAFTILLGSGPTPPSHLTESRTSE